MININAKKFFTIVALTGLLLSMPLSTHAKTKDGKCIYTYCNKPCYGQSVYCMEHDPTYKASHVLEECGKWFEQVVFAIYCRDYETENYSSFTKHFK